ncbi:hypothetical protein MMC12_000164 [Toensbergia leucococca]|nr:hypothetical protein [Toensbergia leucococca]
MQPALQRLLVNPSALSLLRNVIDSPRSLGFTRSLSYRSCRFERHQKGSRSASSITLQAGSKDEDASPQLRSLPSLHKNGSQSIKNTRSTGDWRDRLTTFEQHQYESDLENIPTQGRRLVDHEEYSRDVELWLHLFCFRRRIFGNDGAAMIWREMQNRCFELPPTGEKVDELWELLLELGFSRRKVLQELWNSAKTHLQTKGTPWPKLYVNIVGHFLRIQPRMAYSWHKRLFQDFPPSLEQLEQMFEQPISDASDELAAFNSVYMRPHICSVYKIIIPTMCRKGNCDAAIKWHFLLMQVNDLPTSSLIMKPLQDQLAVEHYDSRLMDIVQIMMDSWVPWPKSTQKSLKDNFVMSRETLNRMLGEAHGIAPKSISDKFCARLFATSMFSIDMVINGLRVLSVDRIGPLSLRELVRRENSSPESIRPRIDQLEKAGISLGSSVFSKVVRRQVLDNNSRMLEEVINCDQHPEAFEDWKLQQSLLTSYYRAGDEREISRTLAILAVQTSEDYPGIERWNLALRSALTRQDSTRISQTLQAMQESHVQITTKTALLAGRYLLPERRVGRRPTSMGGLPTIINIWQEALRTGSYVPPVAWREVLRRLGMSGHLEEFEKLALWLADWYSDPAGRASQMTKTLERQKLVCNSMYSSQAEDFPTHDPRHPLRIIFTSNAQRAIIVWGFQYRTGARNVEDRKSTQYSCPAGSSVRPTWIWGSRLLVELRRRKVVVPPELVAAACKHAFNFLFGSGLSNRNINRRARAENRITVEEYVDEIERVWGIDLFTREEHLLSPP